MIALISENLFHLFFIIGLCLLIFVPLLLGVVIVLFADRKIWAAVQKRKGPNVVGPFGLFQIPADGLKFLFKEIIIPDGADKTVYFIAPILTSTLAIAAWAVIPIQDNIVLSDINVGVLYIFAMSSLGIYGILMAGWASNSKYPFLGALRSAAQMVSYEVSIGFVIVTVLMCVGSLNLSEIVYAQKNIWFFIPLFPMFVVFFISALAETNRPPFDLPEAESELVAGYQTEYSAMPFLLFFLGEYINILLMCAMMTIMFFGGWYPPIDVAPFNLIPGFIWFLVKMMVIFYMISMVKAFVPRYRYDQLMRLGWKVFLPLSLLAVVVTSSVLFFFNLAPVFS
ncbi:NADH-quinone oxidoreductase subunit NuoH [Pelagibacteraceae bacterium]|nr:NADH-quinone oxidoreductase subunit NuoH [Pelagibacteraceae bacterium]